MDGARTDFSPHVLFGAPTMIKLPSKLKVEAEAKISSNLDGKVGDADAVAETSDTKGRKAVGKMAKVVVGEKNRSEAFAMSVTVNFTSRNGAKNFHSH